MQAIFDFQGEEEHQISLKDKNTMQWTLRILLEKFRGNFFSTFMLILKLFYLKSSKNFKALSEF